MAYTSEEIKLMEERYDLLTKQINILKPIGVNCIIFCAKENFMKKESATKLRINVSIQDYQMMRKRNIIVKSKENIKRK